MRLPTPLPGRLPLNVELVLHSEKASDLHVIATNLNIVRWADGLAGLAWG